MPYLAPEEVILQEVNMRRLGTVSIEDTDNIK